LTPQTNTADTGEGKQDTESDAQTPDRLHFQTVRLGRSYPVTVTDIPAFFGEPVCQCSSESVCGRIGTGNIPNHVAFEVRERLADNDGDNDDSDQQERIHSRIDKKWENSIHEEDKGDGAVHHSNAGHADCAHEHPGGYDAAFHYFRNKVRGHANDRNERDCLENPNDLEGRTKCSMIKSSHFLWWVGHGSYEKKRSFWEP